VAVTVTIALALQGKYNLNKAEDVKSLVDEAFTWASKELETEEEKSELEKYMKQPTLELLQLDEGSKIGYTYKTMGAGFHAFLYGKDFSVIETLTMEGGDADTNCAVGGALLG
jgi:ADP-ribosylglycohydrolase